MTADARQDSTAASSLWGWLRGAGAVAVAMAVMNAAAYGFTLIAVHNLVPDDFGAMTALLGLILIGNVVSLGLQATGARRVATHGAADGDAAVLAGSLLLAGRRAAVVLGGASLVATPLIMWLLHIDALVAVLLLAPTFALLTMMGSQLGVLQGGKHWHELGAMYAAQGIGRICFGAAGLMLKPDLTGAMAGVAVGAAVPVLLGLFLLRGSSASSAAETKRVVRETLHGTHTLLAFFAIANTDVLLARNLLDADVSGIYAAGVIIAKAGLFLPQFVIVVVFPSLASAPGDTRRLTRAIGAVAGLALCAIAGTALLPDLVVRVVGGEEYAAIGPVAWLFAITGSTYAVLQMVVYAAIAQQERRAAPAMWVGLCVLCLIAFILLGFDVATQLTGVKVLAATAATVAFCLTVVLALGLHRSGEAADGQEG